MHESLLVQSVLSVVILLVVATGVSFALRNSKLPYTVALVLVGLLVGFLALHIPSLAFMQSFSLQPEMVFYIFLPTLIFESAFHTEFRHYRQNIASIFTLSTLGMLMSTSLVGLGMHYLIGMPWSISFLFGALISATDPISVLALFKKIGAPKRLATIIEGESLFNDAVALVLFGLLLEGFAEGGWLASIESFLYVVIGGSLIGLLMGLIFSKALDYVRNSKEIEISLTLILAHSTFIVAEYFFGVSGILATVVAGLIIGNYGGFKISRDVKNIMEHFWDYSAYLANSILFLMVGLVIFDSRADLSRLILPLLGVIGITLLARMFMVYTLLPLLNKLVPKQKIPLSWMHIIQWSGLRGALAIALILTIPADFPHLDELIIFTVGVIFFTITFNGLTIGPIMSRFKLKKLSAAEYFEHDENVVFINGKVQEKLRTMYEKNFISEKIYKLVRNKYDKDCQVCSEHIQEMFQMKELNQKQLNSILRRHLLGIERRVFTKLYYNGEITQELLSILIANIERQLEKDMDGEKTELGRLTWIQSDGRIAKFMQTLGFYDFKNRIKRKEIRLRYEMFRARAIAIDHALDTLKSLKKEDIYPDVSIIEDYQERYKTWRKKAKEKLKSLEKNHPDLCLEIQHYLAGQAAFHTEEKTLNYLNQNGMCTAKVHQSLVQDLEERQNEAIRKACGPGL